MWYKISKHSFPRFLFGQSARKKTWRKNHSDNAWKFMQMCAAFSISASVSQFMCGLFRKKVDHVTVKGSILFWIMLSSWVLYPKEMMKIPCNKSIFFLKQTQMYVKKWVWIFLSSLEKPSSRHLFSTILHAWTPKKAGFPLLKKKLLNA